MTDTTPNRQQAGAPNSTGGQFRETSRTESGGDLGAETPAQAATRRADADLNRALALVDGFQHRARLAALRALDLDVQARFPDATEVHFVRDWHGDDWHIASIADKDGNELDGTDRFEDRMALKARMANFGDSVTAYLDEEEARHGDGAVLHVGKAIDSGSADISAADAAHLLGPIHDALQTVGGSWDIDEVRYKVFEDPEDGGFEDGEPEALIAKYGSQDAAMDAIAGTRAYLDLDDSIYQAAREVFEPGIQDAVTEALK